MIKKCCVCSMVKMDGKWQSRNVPPAGKRISHAYCPSCFATTMARINQYIPGKTKKLHDAELNNVLYGT